MWNGRTLAVKWTLPVLRQKYVFCEWKYNDTLVAHRFASLASHPQLILSNLAHYILSTQLFYSNGNLACINLAICTHRVRGAAKSCFYLVSELGRLQYARDFYYALNYYSWFLDFVVFFRTFCLYRYQSLINHTPFKNLSE